MIFFKTENEKYGQYYLIIAEKYQVISQLGQGASSVVIKAKNMLTG